MYSREVGGRRGAARFQSALDQDLHGFDDFALHARGFGMKCTLDGKSRMGPACGPDVHEGRRYGANAA